MNEVDAVLDQTEQRTTTDADNPLDIIYTRHERIGEAVDIVRYCLGSLSIGFGRWDEPKVKGPGFYLVMVSSTSVEAYADPMGTNYWPIEKCKNVFDGIDQFYCAAADVASDSDGAVVASIDGALQQQMVRLKDPAPEVVRRDDGSRVEYADWMGSRHMSALDTSMRRDVVATITLSEENGRVTVFADGKHYDYDRSEIGGRWRSDEDD